MQDKSALLRLVKELLRNESVEMEREHNYSDAYSRHLIRDIRESLHLIQTDITPRSKK